MLTTNEPTGIEPYTPVKIKSTSATERGGFRKCRRQWFLSTVHRLDPVEGSIHFFLGTLYHAALQSYYDERMGGNAHDDAAFFAMEDYASTGSKMLDDIKKRLGIAATIGMTEYTDYFSLGKGMLERYMEREANDPLVDQVIAVEQRVNIPILAHDDGKYKIGVLSVQADLVGMKDGELTVVDHKTAGQAMPSAHLDLDDQLTAEAYSWWKASGDFPTRIVYNVSYKKEPHEPKLLKNGSLSKDRGTLTNHDLYLAAIRKHGLDEADYTEHLTWLAERPDPFFHREVVFRTMEQMEAFEKDLRWEWKDMRLVAKEPARAYPNPTSMNCMSCSVRTICTTMQDGGDVEAIVKSFVVATPRR